MAKKRLTRRVTLTLPVTLVQDADYVAGRLGITRSALLSEVITDTLSPLSSMLSSLPDQPTPSDIKRLKGASVVYIKEQVTNALEQLKGVGNG